MNDTEYFDFEQRSYPNPTTSRDEQLDFITTLRDTMADKQAQVNAQTYALGSQLPSRLGGLSGGEATFEARYRTPQLEQTAAGLRSTAQAAALNTALTNLQNAYKKRYNDAMLAYQRRAATPSTTGGGGGGDDDGAGDDETLLNVKLSGKTESQQQLDNAVANAQNWGAQNAFTNASVFQYNMNGVPQYGTIYRDKLGNIIGVETGNGFNYNADAGRKFLTDLANNRNLFDQAGKTLTALGAMSGF